MSFLRSVESGDGGSGLRRLFLDARFSLWPSICAAEADRALQSRFSLCRGECPCASIVAMEMRERLC